MQHDPAETIDLDATGNAEKVEEDLATLRSRCPVHLPPMARRLGAPVYLVTTAQHARLVARHEAYSAYAGSGSTVTHETCAAATAPLFEQDGAEHRRTRRAVANLFSRRAARGWASYAAKITRARMAELAPRGHCDAMGDLALRVPWWISGGLLGIRERDRHHLAGAGQRAFLHQDPGGLDKLLLDAIARRRREPADDLISRVLALPASEQEVLRFARIMSAASAMTTADALGTVLLHLAQHPDLQTRCISQPELLPSLVDELVRLWPAAPYTSRRVRRTTTLGRQTIPEGALVTVHWHSAARDPGEFEDADEVRLDRRRAGAHLGWGAGAHRCLGREIALATIPAIVGQVITAIPRYELAAPVQRSAGYLGIRHLPLRWTPPSRGVPTPRSP